jgi:hypothetical protein
MIGDTEAYYAGILESTRAESTAGVSVSDSKT